MQEEFFEMGDNMDGEPIEQYQCGICSKIFSSKVDFIEQHINTFAKKLICCKCSQSFTNSDDLYDHHDIHKDDENYEVVYQSESGEGEELFFMKEGQELVEVRQPDGTEMVYILDESDQNCIDEVIVQEDDFIQVRGTKRKRPIKPGQLVSLEHGYVLSGDTIVTNRRSAPSSSAFTTKRAYSPPKARAPPLRKRHEVPDFSATEYAIVEPNDEFNATHFKCQRCEQLFINKFGFFRHIEKGKCYVNGCDVCSSTFASNHAFYAHYVAEHTDRAICNFCFRTFMYEKNVKEHMLRHLDQFRHRCEECNKGFYTVREYRNHYKNRHMGIRHKCEVCGRSFADEYYFRRHRETHEKAPKRASFIHISEKV